MSTEIISDEEWLGLKRKLEKSIKHYHGRGEVLESAWGSLLLASQLGWRVAFIMHNQATIKNYEKITGVKFREFCPAETPLSDRSLGYRAAKKLSSLWKAFRGEEPIPDRAEIA